VIGWKVHGSPARSSSCNDIPLSSKKLHASLNVLNENVFESKTLLSIFQFKEITMCASYVMVSLPSKQPLREEIPFLKLQYKHLHLDSNRIRDMFDTPADHLNTVWNRKVGGDRSYNLGNMQIAFPNRIHTERHNPLSWFTCLPEFSDFFPNLPFIQRQMIIAV